MNQLKQSLSSIQTKNFAEKTFKPQVENEEVISNSDNSPAMLRNRILRRRNGQNLNFLKRILGIFFYLAFSLY